nr:probable NAD(P)H dehydrogenase (quinone) FQR1-like 1 [Nicotiana tomentosiformis]
METWLLFSINGRFKQSGFPTLFLSIISLYSDSLIHLPFPPKKQHSILQWQPKSTLLCTRNSLRRCEGDDFVFGFPTRFGMMPAQFKAFLDPTGGLWRTQQLAGKPVGIFLSTGSQGGGQETTALVPCFLSITS